MAIDNKQLEDLAASIKSLANEIKSDRKKAKKEDGKSTSTSYDPNLGSQEAVDLLKQRIELEDDAAKKARLWVELKEAELELTNDIFDAQMKGAGTAKRQAKLQKEYEKSLKSQREEIDALRKSTDKYEGSADGVAGALQTLTGVSKSFNTTLAGQVTGLFKSGEEMSRFGENLRETYTLGNIAEASFQKLGQTALFGFQNMFSELEEGTTSFVRATGATRELTEAVVESSKQFRQYGVTVADAGAAQAMLMATFPTRELGEVSTELAATFSLWEKSGVAISDSVGSYETLRRAFNMTNEDTLHLQKSIMALGDEIGMGGPRMIQAFADAAPRLAIHGASMEKVFRRVASTSAQLGLEVNDILALAEGFQTFEGSAQAAGKLNSILGGGFIDNIQLMNASFEDPAKAAEMIQQSFRAAGQTVESLGPAGVKAAAAAAGFNDVAKFTRFLNGEIDAAELAADEEMQMQKDMLEAAKGTQTILQQFSDAFQAFFNDTLMTPLMEMLQFFSGFSGGVKALIFGLGGVLTTALVGAAGAALGATIGTAEAAIVAPAVAAAVAGGDVTSAISNAIPGRGMMAGAGKLLGRASAVGAGLMVGKDIFDVAFGTDGGATGENIGGATGGVIGGAIGAAFGGPVGFAIGAAIGNTAGEFIGEAFSDEKKKADASMPDKVSATDARIDKLTSLVEQQTNRDREIKLKLDVDEYAYRKGFRVSAEDMLAQKT